MGRRHLIGIVIGLCGAGSAAAENENENEAEADVPASATSVKLDREDLARRPHDRPTDLLRHIPGLVVVQEASGGPAPQWLGRGLDAGQGADLALTADGVPLNLSSHAKSHGYADPHFIIPETVQSIDVHRGPYAARFGDFASAGVLALKTIDEVDGAKVALGTGSELTGPVVRKRLRRLHYRFVGMASPDLGRGQALLATEIGIIDGPYVHPQRFRRGALLGKWKGPAGGGTLAIATTFYTGRWAESGMLSAAEVRAGRLDEFSAADPSQGATATRASASVAYDVDTGDRGWHLAGYAVTSDLRAFRNPTLFLEDPDAGDALEHADRRRVLGVRGHYRRDHALWRLRGRLRIGGEARSDAGVAQVWHVERRNRLEDCFRVQNPCEHAAPRMTNLAAYVEEELAIGGRLRVLLGGRLDEYVFDVDDLDPETVLGPESRGGTGARARFSPKLGAIVRASPAIEVIALAAAGADEADVRASAETNGYNTFVRTWTAEVGARVRPDPRLAAAIAAFTQWHHPERRWVPGLSAGTNAPERQHTGVDATVTFDPTPWFHLDGDLTVSRAESREGDEPDLPYVPRVHGSGGASLGRAARFVSVRVRGLGARATDDAELQATGFFVIDLLGHLRWRGFDIDARVENILDASWRETQLASRVRTSRYVEVTEALLFTPGAPRTVFLTFGRGL